MKDKNNRLKKLLKENWQVDVDRGHKEALKYKLEELATVEERNDLLEYSGGKWSTGDERRQSGSQARTDFRPIWAAAMILLAVAILLFPRFNKQPHDPDDIRYLTAAPQIIILQNWSNKSKNGDNELDKTPTGEFITETRYHYFAGDLVFESAKIVPDTDVINIFTEMGWNKLFSDEIQMIVANVPVGYVFIRREGENLFYGPPEEK